MRSANGASPSISLPPPNESDDADVTPILATDGSDGAFSPMLQTMFSTLRDSSTYSVRATGAPISVVRSSTRSPCAARTFPSSSIGSPTSKLSPLLIAAAAIKHLQARPRRAWRATTPTSRCSATARRRRRAAATPPNPPCPSRARPPRRRRQRRPRPSRRYYMRRRRSHSSIRPSRTRGCSSRSRRSSLRSSRRPRGTLSRRPPPGTSSCQGASTSGSLERAASEGREPAARRFLVTLNRMAAAAHGTKPQRRTAERPNETRRTRPEAGAATDPGRGTSGQEYVAEGEDRAPTAADLARVSAAAGGRGPRRFALPPSVDESGLLKSGAGAPGEAYGEEEDGEEGQWEQVSKRRNKSSRRRRLWPAGSGGPASAPSDEAPNDSLLDLDPELKRIEDGGVAFDIEPPQIEREPSPRSAFEAVTRGRSNAPLPTWTSWAEDVEEEEHKPRRSSLSWRRRRRRRRIRSSSASRSTRRRWSRTTKEVGRRMLRRG